MSRGIHGPGGRRMSLDPQVSYVRHPDGLAVRTETIAHLTADGVAVETHVECRWVSRRAMWAAFRAQILGWFR